MGRRSWGAIRRVPGGKRWQARYVDPDTRRVVAAPHTFATKREAGSWLDAKRTDLDRGNAINDQTGLKPLGDWWPGYKQTLATLKPTTQTSYEMAWRLRVEPTFGPMSVRRIRPSHVEDWQAKLTESGTSASKVIEAHGLLKRVLDRAVRDRAIATNPALMRKKALPRRPKIDRPVLTPAEITRLTEAMRRDDDKVLVRLLAYGGLRIGEALALRRRDLDPVRHTLAIRTSVEDVKGYLHVGETKGGEDRTITLPKVLSEDLARQLDGMPPGPDALIFGNRKGGYRRYRNWRRDSFDPAVAKAGLQLTPHDLRGTAASLLIDAGASVKDVQLLLGHQDETTTIKLYARVRPERSADLASRMSALMAEG